MDTVLYILEYLVQNGSEIGTLLLGVSAFLTLVFAFFRGKSWYETSQIYLAKQRIALQRQEQQRRFKFKIATEAIDLFHRFERDIEYIRSPALTEGEKQEIQALEETNNLITKMKQHTDLGASLLRIDKRIDTIQSINALRPKFKAVFDNTSPFETATTIHAKIKRSALALIRFKLPDDKSDEYETNIWREDANDTISEDIRKAVKEIEEICTPAIREETLQTEYTTP